MPILITIFLFGINNFINWIIPVSSPFILCCSFKFLSKFDQFINDLWPCNLVLRYSLACRSLLNELCQDYLM